MEAQVSCGRGADQPPTLCRPAVTPHIRRPGLIRPHLRLLSPTSTRIGFGGIEPAQSRPLPTLSEGSRLPSTYAPWLNQVDHQPFWVANVNHLPQHSSCNAKPPPCRGSPVHAWPTGSSFPDGARLRVWLAAGGEHQVDMAPRFLCAVGGSVQRQLFLPVVLPHRLRWIFTTATIGFGMPILG